MGAFSRSWQITKLSFSVIGKDKEILLFPVLSSIFSLLFLLALIFPTIIVGLMAGDEVQFAAGEYILLFIVYLGLAFIATFFNVCTVYTAKIRFSGGNATFTESIKFAFSRIHLIFLWALVSATVGIILRLIENMAQKLGSAGKIVLLIFRGILSMAWGIATIFVVPSLVYNNLGPFAAIKQSVNTLKRTWGESLIRHFGLGLVQFIFLFIGFIIFLILFLLTSGIGLYALLIVFFLAIVYFVLVFLIFSAANVIFNTALYEYASTGKIPSGFDTDVLEYAFERKN